MSWRAGPGRDKLYGPLTDDFSLAPGQFHERYLREPEEMISALV